MLLLLSSKLNRRRSCVFPVLLTYPFPLVRLRLYRPAERDGLNGPYVWLAAALKSPGSKAAVPNVPFLISTLKPWNRLSGSPPPITPFLLTLSVTLMMTALSGRLEVLKERMLRYCLSATSSPRLKVVAAVFIVPPAPLVSVDSSTQPSFVPFEAAVMNVVATRV